MYKALNSWAVGFKGQISSFLVKQQQSNRPRLIYIPIATTKSSRTKMEKSNAYLQKLTNLWGDSKIDACLIRTFPRAETLIDKIFSPSPTRSHDTQGPSNLS